VNGRQEEASSQIHLPNKREKGRDYWVGDIPKKTKRQTKKKKKTKKDKKYSDIRQVNLMVGEYRQSTIDRNVSLALRRDIEITGLGNWSEQKRTKKPPAAGGFKSILDGSLKT